MKQIRPLLLVAVAVSGPASAQVGPPPVPPENPITEEKRILGKALFWEEQLSSDNTIACGTCHVPSAGGVDPRAGSAHPNPGPDGVYGTPDDRHGSPGVVGADADGALVPDPSFGLDAQVTPRLANSVVGAAYFPELFWDGRASSTFVDPETLQVSIPSGGALESQAVGPIVSSVEMAGAGRAWEDVRAKLERVQPLALAPSLTPDLATRLSTEPDYPELFQDAFGDPAITAERIAYALATYERTLIPDETPFDLFLLGQTDALTQKELEGFGHFIGPEARCEQCHGGALMTDFQYRNIGLRPVDEDRGRQEVTGDSADRGRFKVPSLRNVGLRERFFHNGDPAVLDLEAAIRLYDGSGGDFADNRDPILDGVSVSPDAARSIAVFLRGALTDQRVATEMPPFDRPGLRSEEPPSVTIFPGTGTPGGGGVPQLVGLVPAFRGNAEFRIGVGGALGGADAFLAWSFDDPLGPPTGGLRTPWITLASPVVLSGSGPDGGYATFRAGLPNNPSLVGMEAWFQWWVRDPSAQGPFAKSDVGHMSVF